MGTVISNLKARFGVDTTDFKKGLKDGEKATEDFKGAAGGILEEFASMFGVNMSGVTSALSTANKSLSFLGASFKGAAAGGNILSISMKVLKFALIATGIGAIVVVLGSLIAYFTKSGEGADKFAKMLAEVKSVVNNVIDRLAVFGKGVFDLMTGKFKQGWEEMTSAFKGMGEEIKEDWKAVGALADAEEALQDREIALITVLEERKQKIQELRLAAKDLDLTESERLAKLNEAEKLQKANAKDEIAIEKERLRIMKEKLAIQISDPTDEQRKEIKLQEGKISAIIAQQLSDTRSLTRERNALIKIVDKEFNQFRSFSQLKIPQLLDKKVYENINTSLKELHHSFVAVKESSSALFQVMGQVAVDATASINSAFEGLASGMGEFIGALLTGDAGIKDFGKMIGGVFADLAITVGKIAIGAGMAVLGIKEALMTLNPWVAILAGVALVALGTAVKGSLKSAASGGGGSAVSSGSAGSNGTYDTRTSAASTSQLSFPKTITLVAKGGDLVGVLNIENRRRGIVT